MMNHLLVQVFYSHIFLLFFQVLKYSICEYREVWYLIFLFKLHFRDKNQVIIGDENHLTLIINARNEGEGAYEAELFVMIPEEADYVGIERSNKVNLK